jgi:serine/threonine protein kinase
MGELIDGTPLFPGETEIDQLYIIQKVQGSLTPEQNELFYRNPNFKGFKFPDMSNPRETLERKFSGLLSKEGFEFLKGMLAMDPNDRLTGRQCLEHEYFHGIDVNIFIKDHEDLSRFLDNALYEKSSNNGSKVQVKQLPELPGKIVSTKGASSKDTTPRTERKMGKAQHDGAPAEKRQKVC